MSSDLKVTNIKHESSSSNNLVLASDGSANIDGLNIKDSALVTDTNKYAFVKGGELNSLGYLNRNFFGASYYLSAVSDVTNNTDTALTSGFTWTKQPSSGSSGSDDADIFGRFSGGQFTGGVSGYYLTVMSLTINDIDDGEKLEISVRINNDANKKIAIQRVHVSTNNDSARASCSGIASLDTNDTLTPYVYHNEGSSRPVQADIRSNISFYYLGTSDL